MNQLHPLSVRGIAYALIELEVRLYGYRKLLLAFYVSYQSVIACGLTCQRSLARGVTEHTSSNQFPRVERLGHIVIRSCEETLNFRFITTSSSAY
jgi:hypothetical protein